MSVPLQQHLLLCPDCHLRLSSAMSTLTLGPVATSCPCGWHGMAVFYTVQAKIQIPVRLDTIPVRPESAQPCGCDPGCVPPYVCAAHQIQDLEDYPR